MSAVPPSQSRPGLFGCDTRTHPAFRSRILGESALFPPAFCPIDRRRRARRQASRCAGNSAGNRSSSVLWRTPAAPPGLRQLAPRRKPVLRCDISIRRALSAAVLLRRLIRPVRQPQEWTAHHSQLTFPPPRSGSHFRQPLRRSPLLDRNTKTADAGEGTRAAELVTLLCSSAAYQRHYPHLLLNPITSLVDNGLLRQGVPELPELSYQENQGKQASTSTASQDPSASHEAPPTHCAGPEVAPMARYWSRDAVQCVGPIMHSADADIFTQIFSAFLLGTRH